MDNNQQQPPVAAPAPAQPTPAAPPVTPKTAQPGATPGGGNKMIFWLISGIVLIILLVGGIYWYLSKQQAVQPTPTQQTTNAPVQQDTLDQDLNSIDVQATDSDFTSIDQDLQSL